MRISRFSSFGACNILFFQKEDVIDIIKMLAEVGQSSYFVCIFFMYVNRRTFSNYKVILVVQINKPN